jgi:hypothetical protein
MRSGAKSFVTILLGLVMSHAACSSTQGNADTGSSGAPSTSGSSGTPGTSGSSGTPAPSATTTTTPPVLGPPGFDLTKQGNTYVATSKANPQIKIEVDCDDKTDDDHYFSITPIINGKRMDGPLWETNIGLLLHDDDASYNLTNANRCVSVEVVGDRLVTKFLSGTYKNLSPTGAEKPVPMDTSFRLDTNGRLVAELTGLYYVLPTVNNTKVLITTKGTVVERTITPATETLEYFDNVTLLDVNDPTYGHFTIETNVVLLQLQRDLAYNRFELDFDHTFKDKGQESVTSKITFF